LGAIGGGVGAIGIQKWRVARLESEAEGLRRQLEVAKATSFGKFVSQTRAMKEYFEGELRKKDEEIVRARAAGEEEKARSLEEFRERIKEVVLSTGSTLEEVKSIQVTYTPQEDDRPIAEWLRDG